MIFKLMGIEMVDLSKAKKVLGILDKLTKIDEDFGEGYLSVYNERGEKRTELKYEDVTSWSDGWMEKIYFVTVADGDKYVNWLCYMDKDDGYRSYSGFYKFESKDIKLTWNLEKYDLKCNIKEGFKKEKKNPNYEGEIDSFDYHLEVKVGKKTVYACYTDNSDNYYPIACMDDKVVELELK